MRTGDVTGHLPVMPRAKRALERARREALALGDQYIGVEHVLLGLLDPKNNTAVELLRRLDTDPDVIRVRVLADLGKAA
jgi:ATP-dependent Clp protease ATP-binding subunit ClpC